MNHPSRNKKPVPSREQAEHAVHRHTIGMNMRLAGLSLSREGSTPELEGGHSGLARNGFTVARQRRILTGLPPSFSNATTASPFGYLQFVVAKHKMFGFSATRVPYVVPEVKRGGPLRWWPSSGRSASCSP